jgi:hypothetical protein
VKGIGIILIDGIGQLYWPVKAIYGIVITIAIVVVGTCIQVNGKGPEFFGEPVPELKVGVIDAVSGVDAGSFCK